MIHAYDKMYVKGAMIRMGDMFEYVALDLGIDIDIFFKMFLDSTASRKFEIGNVSIVAGKSGVEIAQLVLEEIDFRNDFIKPTWREDRSDYYWAGWVLAYFQWIKNMPFKNIWKYISIRNLLKIYPTYHEADISRAVMSMERAIKKPASKDIAELRIIRGWSQAQLAEMAHMSVSQLQRLEYGERKTDNLTLKTALALANALGVDVEELLESKE